jgi:hypothetical protein
MDWLSSDEDNNNNNNNDVNVKSSLSNPVENEQMDPLITNHNIINMTTTKTMTNNNDNEMIDDDWISSDNNNITDTIIPPPPPLSVNFNRKNKDHSTQIRSIREKESTFSKHKQYTNREESDSDENEQKNKKIRKVFKGIVKEDHRTIKNTKDTKKKTEDIIVLNDLLNIKKPPNNIINNTTTTNNQSDDINTKIWSENNSSSTTTKKNKKSNILFTKDDIVNLPSVKDQCAKDIQNPLNKQLLFYQKRDTFDNVGNMELDYLVNKSLKENNGKNVDITIINDDKEEEEYTNNNVNNNNDDNIVEDNNNNKLLSSSSYNLLDPNKSSKKAMDELKDKSIGSSIYLSNANKSNSNRKQLYTIGATNSDKDQLPEFEKYLHDTNHTYKDLGNIMKRLTSRVKIENIPANRRFLNLDILNKVEFITRAEEDEYLRTPYSHERKCIREEKCEGNFIPNSQPVILVEFLNYKERLERKEESSSSTSSSSTPKKSRNLCIMCQRWVAQYFYASIKSTCQMLNQDITLVKYINITDKPGEYCSNQCISGNGSYWQGIPGPIVAHNRNYYQQYIGDDGTYHFKQTGYNYPDEFDTNTPYNYFD